MSVVASWNPRVVSGRFPRGWQGNTGTPTCARCRADAASVELRPSSGGKYLGVTITITATSREQLDDLYRALTSHPLVKVVL